MADIEKVINELVGHIESALDVDSDYVDCVRTDLLQVAVGLLKEQEVEIRQLRLALDIAKGTCKGIVFETDEKFMGDL